MSRVIKFRAWDKEEKVMIDADSFYLSDEFQPLSDSFDNAQVGFELMQFTGLLDKNGKESYEEDLVKTNYKPALMNKCPDSCISNLGCQVLKIIFNERSASFFGCCINCGILHALDKTEFQNKFEVTGNLLENPELISESPGPKAVQHTILNGPKND